jgi:hypothetical protein
MRTERHNIQSVYNIVLIAKQIWQYSWQSMEWRKYRNIKFYDTNSNGIIGPQLTDYRKHFVVGQTKVTVLLTVII